MKILITGSSGFIGSHLLKAFRSKNKAVEYDLKEGLDILDKKTLDKHMKNIEVVIHLAAFVSGPESWEKPEEYLVNNGVGTFRVFSSAVKNGVRRIIYASSAAIYGNPLTPYGASKRWGEEVAEIYKNQIETIVLRPFNIYGPGQNPAYGYAIHNFIEGIMKKGEIRIYGDGRQTRDFIYIEDVIGAMNHFLTSPIFEKPIDLGRGKEVEILKLAGIIGKLLNKKYKIKFLPKRKELYKSRAKISSLRKAGVDPDKFHSLEKGLVKLLNKSYDIKV